MVGVLVMGFAKGGLVSGDARLRIERVGVCANGHCLYVIGFDSPPEHVVTAAEVRAGDRSKLECQAELDGA